MARSTRSSGKSKADENNSARCSIPSGPRRSERLLKRTAPTDTKRKFERFGKPITPSPTRRYERVKNLRGKEAEYEKRRKLGDEQESLHLLPMPDGKLSLRPSGTASPSHGSDIIHDANSLAPKQQTLGEVPIEVSENGKGLNECYNDNENKTDAVMLKSVASSDQQEGISRTINEDSVSQEIPVSFSHSEQPLVISSPVVAANEVLRDLCTSLSTSGGISKESLLSNQDVAEEVQNFSQEVEPLSNPIDVGLPNQSNCESPVMELLMEEQQLPTSESPSSNQDTVEEMHNPSSQDGHLMANRDLVRGLLPVERPSSNENTVEGLQNSSQQIESACCPVNYTPHALLANRETLVMGPIEHSQQLASVELPSSNLHLSNLPLAPTTKDQQINEVTVSTLVSQAIDHAPNQVVVQLDSMTPTGGRTHLSNTSAPQISRQPTQAATPSASNAPPPLYLDPFEIEIGRIHEKDCQAHKDHEILKLQLKSDHEKELKEIFKRHNVKLQGVEVEYQQEMENLDANINKVLAMMRLAEAMRSKCWGPRIEDAMGLPKDANFAQQSVQLHGEQSAVRSSPVDGPSSCMPPATTLQSGFAMARPQLMAAPIQYSYGSTGNFSNVPARPPRVIGNIPAFAPYPQPYGSLTSVPTTSHPNPLLGRSNPLIPSNIPAFVPSPQPYGSLTSVPTTSHPNPLLGRSNPLIPSNIPAFAPSPQPYGSLTSVPTTSHPNPLLGRSNPLIPSNIPAFAPSPQPYGSLTSVPTTSHPNPLLGRSNPLIPSNIPAFAPSPQSYGSLTSVPTTSHPNPLLGRSNPLIPSNIPATPLSFPRLSPQPTPPTYRVGADSRDRGQWPFNFYGMNNLRDAANQFGGNLPNVRPQ